MSILPWISDQSLKNVIDKLVEQSENALKQAPKRVQKNVADPFRTLIVSYVFKPANAHELKQILHSESALRGGSNAIGHFHQGILSSIDGWSNHDKGHDIKNVNRKIFAEIKNKHNTMNSTNYDGMISSLNIVSRHADRDWDGYLVSIISNKKERYKREIVHKNHSLYSVDGATFYEIATGSKNALQELYNALEEILETKDYVKDYCREILAKAIL